jgi:hypothetical protein
MQAVTAKARNTSSGACWVPTTENPAAAAKAVTTIAPRSDPRLSARPVTNGRIVNRVTAGTAVMTPIHDASIPTALSHTGKNGRWVPISPNSVP